MSEDRFKTILDYLMAQPWTVENSGRAAADALLSLREEFEQTRRERDEHLQTIGTHVCWPRTWKP